MAAVINAITSVMRQQEEKRDFADPYGKVSPFHYKAGSDDRIDDQVSAWDAPATP